MVNERCRNLTSVRRSFPVREVLVMSQRCRNDVVMGVLPSKGTNGTPWNVMGPARNKDGKGDGRSRNGSREEEEGKEEARNNLDSSILCLCHDLPHDPVLRE